MCETILVPKRAEVLRFYPFCIRLRHSPVPVQSPPANDTNRNGAGFDYLADYTIIETHDTDYTTIRFRPERPYDADYTIYTSARRARGYTCGRQIRAFTPGDDDPSGPTGGFVRKGVPDLGP